MKTKMKKYLFLVVAMIMVVTVAVTAKLNAAETTTGSLTIICHEQRNGDTTTNPPLKGIEYTLYKVDDTCEDDWDASDFVEENNIIGITKVTNDEGKIVFSNLELGRYYANVTKVNDGMYEYEPFVVDIPTTNAQGTGFVYNVIVEPKIRTAYGNLELTKKDAAGNPLKGVTFKLQVKKGMMQNSLGEVTNEWQDYIVDGSDSAITFITDENGRINIENIPAFGSHIIYRLIEVSTLDGYIKNDKILSQFFFTVSEDGTIDSSYNYGIMNNYEKKFINVTESNSSITKIEYINEKPTMTKKVKNSNGAFVDSVGCYINDTICFRITADVPEQISNMETYKITDVLPVGLTIDKSSIRIEGATPEGFEEIPSYFYTISDTGLEVTFDTENMYYIENGIEVPVFNSIIITYNVSLNENNSVIGGNGNINTASLTYTNNIDENGRELSTKTVTDTADVHTGAISIEKVEKGNLTNKLSGAKFKVATTKDNAKAGIFVKDENNVDIEVTTDSNGQAMIKGLAYADDGSDVSYWLVETEAPKYKETVDGTEVEKTYNLLKNPVEVKVGKTTHNTPVQVENSKGLNLPVTGGIGIALFVLVGISIMAYAVIMNKKQKINE